jgi:hypothetical protein
MRPQLRFDLLERASIDVIWDDRRVGDQQIRAIARGERIAPTRLHQPQPLASRHSSKSVLPNSLVFAQPNSFAGRSLALQVTLQVTLEAMLQAPLEFGKTRSAISAGLGLPVLVDASTQVFRIDDPGFVGEDDGVDAVADAKFAEDAGDVGFDSGLAEYELVGDFSVGHAPGE